jgi:hypothetical protein
MTVNFKPRGEAERAYVRSCDAHDELEEGVAEGG